MTFKKLSSGQDYLPIIVVYTYTKDIKIANKIKSDLESKFNNIHFVSVLAEQISNEDDDTFGLDDLLSETLKICQKSTK